MKLPETPLRVSKYVPMSLGICACVLIMLSLSSEMSCSPHSVKPADSVATAAYPYQAFFYKNSNLNLEAYYFRPAGNGPFPLVIYNHGSRAGSERQEVSCNFVASMLVKQGYAVIVPERRGYGKSDGLTYGDEVGSNVGSKMMARFNEEASDVIALVDILKAAAPEVNTIAKEIDFKRVGIMGWSHGGIISLITAGTRHDFAALVNQAGGALTWNGSPTLRSELPKLGEQIKIPALCMDAENDATTDAVISVGEAIKSSGQWEETIIYPAFMPTTNPGHVAPGHLLFVQGVSIWQNDLLKFLQQQMPL
ncbi:hypothetical protein WSM22_37200 [Cytophagales bacterium WSM2-2]|nr:hypothetical protein WSM22_37200 [Cytophagales bacterium WSM2-2]